MTFSRAFALCLFTVILLWITGFMMFVKSVADIPNQEMQNAEAIVVLTGGAERIEEGFRLLNQKSANLLFISGVGKNTSLNDLMGENKIKQDSSLDISNVHLGVDATNTKGNAEEVAAWMESRRLHTLLLVTSNYHMPRSLLEFSPYRSKLTIIPHPVFAKTFVKEKIWDDHKALKLVLDEYHKFIATYLRLWIEPHL